MITQPIDVLKINNMSQEQYERELAAGRINRNEIYVTPAEDDGPTGGLQQVAELIVPLADYEEGEYYDSNGMSQWGKIPKIGGYIPNSDRMLLLEKADEYSQTSNPLLAQLDSIFSARLVCISVLAKDGWNLTTPLIYRETVGSTMTWAGAINSVDDVPTDDSADCVTHLVWADNEQAMNPGAGPSAKYLHLAKGLYKALIEAVNHMDNTPEDPELVFTAYN